LGRSPVKIVAIFYCLRFETSLFVVSYYSQGHGGGIRPLLHRGEMSTESERPPRRKFCLLLSVSTVAAKHVSISWQRFDFYKRIRCYKTSFRDPLSSNGLFSHVILMKHSIILGY
jgi:hypothetical protein